MSKQINLFGVKFEEIQIPEEPQEIKLLFNLLYDLENYFIVICWKLFNSSSNFNLHIDTRL